MASTESLTSFYQTTPHDIPKTAILIAIAVRTSNITNNNVCHSSSHLLRKKKPTHNTFMYEIIALELWIYPSVIYENYLLTILQYTTTQWLRY